jgi:hypothetical protein
MGVGLLDCLAFPCVEGNEAVMEILRRTAEKGGGRRSWGEEECARRFLSAAGVAWAIIESDISVMSGGDDGTLLSIEGLCEDSASSSSHKLLCGSGRN